MQFYLRCFFRMWIFYFIWMHRGKKRTTQKWTTVCSDTLTRFWIILIAFKWYAAEKQTLTWKRRSGFFPPTTFWWMLECTHIISLLFDKLNSISDSYDDSDGSGITSHGYCKSTQFDSKIFLLSHSVIINSQYLQFINFLFCLLTTDIYHRSRKFKPRLLITATTAAANGIIEIERESKTVNLS